MCRLHDIIPPVHRIPQGNAVVVVALPAFLGRVRGQHHVRPVAAVFVKGRRCHRRRGSVAGEEGVPVAHAVVAVGFAGGELVGVLGGAVGTGFAVAEGGDKGAQGGDAG